MKNHRNAIALATIAAACLSGSAGAEEATRPITVTIDNYATIDGSGALLSTHEIDVELEGKLAEWTIGVEGWGGFEFDYDLNEATVETPGFLAYISSDAFGEVQVWDASGALDNACITPTGGSSHFGTDDLLSFGTCGGYGGQTILYISPDLDGFGVQVSAMRDIAGTSDVGSVDGAVSAALTYEHATDAGIEVSASLAADFATSVNGGLAPDQNLPVMLQAGVNIGWDGWIAGAAAQYELNTLAGGNSWGAGIGLGKAVTEQLVVAAELSADGYEDSGVDYDEVSLGATAEYRIVDEVFVDAAFNVVHRTGSDGTDEVSTQFGSGISWAF